ncbi:gastrula zinc finger protein XlCGF42.1 [Anabrus simplex]|uniref:gastrula zinc finger protein XlCGF42.1 n=1 Tax=Anabrus simplex TaxID=316456 RepID=UPI0035A27E36
MEEPCFIKCEPDWQLDSEETSNLESNESLIPSQLVVTTMKVEEREPCIKEECADEYKEVVETEVCDDVCDIKENPLDDVESLSTSSSAEFAESFGNEKKKGYEENFVKNEETPTCSICGKNFKQRKNLSGHMKVHCDIKCFTCPLCGKSFRHQSSLTTHLIVHSDERQFICSTCGMSFNFKVHLTRHQLVHTKVREFLCSICGKEFSQRSSLKRHAYVHEGNGPEACTMCERSFPVRSALIRHMKMHSKERPHSCETCGKTYSQKSHLKRHLKKSSTCVSS